MEEYDFWIVKLNNIGAIDWQKTYGGTANDQLLNLEITNDGGYIMTGNSSSTISGNKTADSTGGFVVGIKDRLNWNCRMAKNVWR